jgi:selenocysteine lyase/cysteine desulfurase
MAPKGTGLLITRPDRLEQTWTLVASGDWAATDHRRFEHVGTANESLIAGLAAAVAFHEQIGREAIEARSRALATMLYEGLSGIGDLQIVSPRAAAMRSAMVSFTKAGETAAQLQGRLGAAGIRTRRISESGYEYLRLSTAIHVLPKDVERVVELIARDA